MPFTRGKKHELRVHYIVTKTNFLSYSRRCKTFQNILLSPSQHILHIRSFKIKYYILIGLKPNTVSRWKDFQKNKKSLKEKKKQNTMVSIK